MTNQNISPLTKRQNEVLSYIANQINDQGYPPTIREIGSHLGMKSTNGVNDHLKALEKKGYLKRSDHKSRSMRILISPFDREISTTKNKKKTNQQLASTDNPKYINFEARNDNNHSNESEWGEFCDVPFLGKVAAGIPILAEEDHQDTVRVSSFFLGRGYKQQKIFALTVVGDSMIEDGIHDGDYLFIKKQGTASTGEIAVIMVEGEATVKRFFHEGDKIRLQPANSAMSPIIIHKDEFKQSDILGVVVGVYRKF